MFKRNLHRHGNYSGAPFHCTFAGNSAGTGCHGNPIENAVHFRRNTRCEPVIGLAAFTRVAWIASRHSAVACALRARGTLNNPALIPMRPARDHGQCEQRQGDQQFQEQRRIHLEACFAGWAVRLAVPSLSFSCSVASAGSGLGRKAGSSFSQTRSNSRCI